VVYEQHVVSLPVRLHSEHVDILLPEHDQSGPLHHKSALLLESNNRANLHAVVELPAELARIDLVGDLVAATPRQIIHNV